MSYSRVRITDNVWYKALHVLSLVFVHAATGEFVMVAVVAPVRVLVAMPALPVARWLYL